MNFELLHPADQIIMMMERIYANGMTTTSGGNLSVRDDNGDVWISPAGVDKGALRREDIVCVKADGRIVGIHKPSSEFPFHRLIYKTRPDLKAIVHAHPPALVAFSIVRRIPNTRLLPNERVICGEIGMAEYALPGSEELGQKIADVFAKGINSVLLENHGVVVGGIDLFEAFKVFETLDFFARLEINACRVGTPVSLTDTDYEVVESGVGSDVEEAGHDSFVPERYGSEERELRREMIKIIHRSYDQRLFTSTQGTFSQRLPDGGFLITPYGMDRKYLDVADLVRIDGGVPESGKTPSRSYKLHAAIYKRHKHIHSIIIAHPPHIMAYAVTNVRFDSRTIPESYILLRSTPRLPFRCIYDDVQTASAVFTEDKPIAIVDNNCVIVTGHNLLNAFDRLEVAEYSALSVIASRSLGDIVPIDDGSIRDLEEAFGLRKPQLDI